MKLQFIVLIALAVTVLADFTNDEIREARKNVQATKNAALIKRGEKLPISIDRVSVYEMLNRDYSCSAANLRFDSNSKEEIDTLLKLLGSKERDSETLKPSGTRKKDFVVAFFSKKKAVSWLLVRRSYDQVIVFQEERFPDGTWHLASGKTVNEFEKWLEKRSISFEWVQDSTEAVRK